MIRVVLVDDHELLRTGVAALLNSEEDIEVVGTAGSAREGAEVIESTRPDVAVVDYSMPGGSGLELCRKLQMRSPKVPVVVLTTFLTDEVVQGAIEAGASAYVAKDVQVEDLQRAIKAVARGDGYLDERVAGRVASWAGKRRRPTPGAPLAPREIEVLRLVGQGATNTAIAEAMVVSENTVRSHLKRILIKLECHTRYEAVAIAREKGYL